ncbi:uncharacterized protein LOC124137109 [Haliotis rufescens]|uniref:uncharacterized protein LOC124137109 n=1 Tax=Haliotis rufescens TaxID=6454 RepID=UPI001EAFDCBB|nr:uncharacterized protein LOC124137109 [Haliotis rufescens]
MKVILVAALLVCLLAIHADGLRLYYHHYRNLRIRLSWRRTTSCIYRAARTLSRCQGVTSRFRYYLGKRAIENEDANNDQMENDELVSARDLYEAANEVGHKGNSAGSSGSISKPVE